LAGRYDAIIGVLAMPTEQVTQLVPANAVQLATQDVTPAGTHPVVFGFGRHHDAHLVHLEWLYKQSYFEFFLGVPYVNVSVRGDGGVTTAPVYYLPRLFLDKFWAVAGGVWWWGFEKQLAQISREGDRYSVRGFLGNEDIISLQTGAMSPKGSLETFPYLYQLADMISQPLLTKVLARLGPWSTSMFDWDWNQAEIWSVEARMTIADAFLPGLTTGTFEFPGIKDVPLGAFRIRTSWTLSVPYSSSPETASRRDLNPAAAR